MALTGALYSGVSGVISNGDALNVIGDNIANINTVGFKSARSVFFDLLSADVGGTKIGNGSRFAAAQRIFSQGGVETTNSSTDLAIQGTGFFVLQDTSGTNYFTRAGQFSLDKDGSLTDPQGLKVQGVQLDSSGNPVSGLTNINVSGSKLVVPTPTANIDVVVNLSASATTPSTALPTDASGTEDLPNKWFASSNFSTVVTTYDSLGATHDLTFTFTKAATAGEWDYRVLANGGEITGGTAGDFQQVNAVGGKMVFNADGSLDTGSSVITDISAAWADGALTQSIPGANLHFDGSTQVALSSAAVTLNQDGNPPGTVTGIQIGSDGVITGQFSSGKSVALYRIAMADFPSEEGLTHVGNTLYAQSTHSGQAVYGSPGTGSLGTILSGSLELSTVDLATQFVQMVTTQRGFEASSKIITVVDTLLEEVANLKR